LPEFTRGKVYLVGAGPGAPDLLTLRAARLLARADIVFTDALVHPDTLALAVGARIVHVGKRAGQVSTEQRFISRALVAAAQHYACVVRLKGGDPMLFGRAQEEIDALRDAQVEHEVVPGISAAFAAAATLDASLTQRGIARSVTFATPRLGHGEPAGEAWLDAVAGGGTAVLYMAAGEADAIARALRSRGFPSEMPCAIVVNATLADESTCISTLGRLATDAASRPPGPAIILIGEAIRAAAPHRLDDVGVELGRAVPLRL
jgi:uroporphyrin-III C-methyltransferase